MARRPPGINTCRYPPHAPVAPARQDLDRRHAAGVDGFQIDSAHGVCSGCGEARDR